MASREKPTLAHDNDPRVFEEEDAGKPVPIIDKVDYSGAYEKTDPKEIALVKKLDRWIMVRFESLLSPTAPLQTQVIRILSD
jgi:hypothetical protein